MVSSWNVSGGRGTGRVPQQHRKSVIALLFGTNSYSNTRNHIYDDLDDVYSFSQVGLDDSQHPIEPNDTFVPVFPDDGDEDIILRQMDRLRTQASQLSVTVFFFEAYIAGRAMESPSCVWWEKMAELCSELKIILVADESLLG